MSQSKGQSEPKRPATTGSYKAGQSGNPSGRKKVLSDDETDQYTAMKRVMLTESSQDESKQQRYLRKWYEADRKRFYAHYARLELREFKTGWAKVEPVIVDGDDGADRLEALCGKLLGETDAGLDGRSAAGDGEEYPLPAGGQPEGEG